MDDTPGIDLTSRTEPLSLSDISRAFRLSRSASQKWHKPPVQAATGNKPPAHKPALHAVAEAIGAGLGPEVLESPRPLYPVSVVVALGKALGYLDHHGRLIGRSPGKGRWFPAEPTIDPATGKKRYYVNHVAAELRIKAASIETGRQRGGAITEPDGTDEMGRIFWWTPAPRPAPAGHRGAARSRPGTPVDPDSIPTSITRLTYGAPGPALSQEQAAALLAHYWPAVEQYIRGQVSADILASPGHVADGDTAWDPGRDREHAALIASGPPADQADEEQRAERDELNEMIRSSNSAAVAARQEAAGLRAALEQARTTTLREAAETGRQLSRQGYSAQEIARQLDNMADRSGGPAGDGAQQ